MRKTNREKGYHDEFLARGFDEISTETEMFTRIRLNDNIIQKSTWFIGS